MYYIIFAIILVFLSIIILFNKIIKSRNMVQEAFSGIDVQLKRRHDLIPNLIEIMKGYANYEKEIFRDIANIRSESFASGNIQRLNQNEYEFTKSLKSILAIVENYPELKANKNFLELQKNLVDIEEQLQYARRYFNGTVRDYNILIESFPGNIIAGTFNYKKEHFFEVEFITQREMPEVSL